MYTIEIFRSFSPQGAKHDLKTVEIKILIRVKKRKAISVVKTFFNKTHNI